MMRLLHVYTYVVFLAANKDGVYAINYSTIVKCPGSQAKEI
jgi:hypothetical protein